MLQSPIKRAGRLDFGKRPVRIFVGHCVAFLIGIGALPALAQAPRRPEVWTIAVGVDKYEHILGVGKPTAARGARDVRDWMRQAGWDGSHQLLLSDFGAPDPGQPDEPASNILPRKANLDWAFRQWLFPKARPGDLVVFYFAGRADAVVTPQGPRVDPRVEYQVLPADASLDSVDKTGWSLDRVIDECARRKLQVVCWMATSVVEREVPAPPPDTTGRRPRSIATGVNWLGRLARWPGMTAWLASDPPPTAEHDPERSNRFTQALLKALGKPDGKARRNLAACLRDLHEDAQLMRQGFRSMGGVPPSLSLWKDQFGSQNAEQKPELVLQTSHSDKLTGVAATADGRFIITASTDSTVRVWSAQEGSLLRVLPGYSAEVGVTALALSHDDRWLVTGGGRGAVLIYDLERDFKTKLVSRQPHAKRIEQIALLPDGFHFVSLDRDGRAFLWDARESPQEPKPLIANRACKQIVSGGRFVPDGKDRGLVVAWCTDGRLRTFDPSGAGGEALEVPPGPLTALAISPDGRFLGFGFGDGKVVIQDRDSQRQTEHQAAASPVKVRRLVFSDAGKIAVEHEKGVRLLTVPSAPGDTAARQFDLIDRPLQSLDFSSGGEYLATSTEGIGALRVWRIGGDAPPATVIDEPRAGASRLGFTGNSRALISGDFGGGVSLRPSDPRAGDGVRWSFPAHDGKIQELSAAPGHRFLLLLDRKGSFRQSRIWDVKDRTCRQLRGTWSSGLFLDDNRLALIADSAAHDLAGRLVLVDRETLSFSPEFFARGSGDFKLPDALALERLAASPDGKWLAAAADASKAPLVCVWETATGKLIHWIPAVALEDAVLSLSFSTDSRYLLTGGDSSAAKLWDLSAIQGGLQAPSVVFSARSVRKNITCAAIRPGSHSQVVTGHSDGQVHLWSWSGQKAKLEIPGFVEGEFSGAVKSLCFTSDGAYLSAAGDGLTIWVGAMDPRPHAIDVLSKLRPHHIEQINTLAAWKDLPVVISGGDDTSVRFWDLKNGSLWGTFAAAPAPVVAASAAVREVDWVFYTPDGLYDAPPAASRLVQYRRQNRPHSLDQFERTNHEYGLSEHLLAGDKPRAAPRSAEPPPISLSVPPRSDPALPSAKLTITLGAKDLKDVRLYHNDVLVPYAAAGPAEDMSFDLEAPLVPDRNRFYVMASREGAYDACSETVEVDYASPRERGQLHVLAIGVGGYQLRRLEFAQRDAQEIGEVFYKRGADAKGQHGESIVLADDRVTEENIEKAFDQIARRVEDRPQDTVVVFLAGHTGVFENPEGFCLLLPTYHFSETDPLRVATRGVGDAIGSRVDPKFVVTYSSIASKLARLRALQRLVIVDACQAEAILEDKRVRAIQKWMEVSSRRARTSYLMAARQGEPALEAGPLRHGLLTYALLRGLGAITLDGEPKDVANLGLRAHADFNDDGVISTNEMDAYVKQSLPRLASIFPATDGSASVAARGPGTSVPSQESARAARIQATEASFNLVPLR
jgi:WD40 repeat protein/uncharacterized caspase-like protein